jgi:hypothetical protein
MNIQVESLKVKSRVVAICKDFPGSEFHSGSLFQVS